MSKSTISIVVILFIALVILETDLGSIRNVVLEEINKNLVISFYQKLYGDHDLNAISDYVSDDYVQHSLTSFKGKNLLFTEAKNSFNYTSKSKINIIQSAVNGDVVFLLTKEKDKFGKEVSLVDVFLVRGTKIAEHWTLQQETIGGEFISMANMVVANRK